MAPVSKWGIVAKKLSPTHAAGKLEIRLSFSSRGYRSAKPRAVVIRARWVRMAPLGRPVVPEV
jgi:hypothetical protein